MVEVNKEQALLIENHLMSVKAPFTWYLANSLDDTTVMIAFHLEGLCFKESNVRYLELTRGIDKSLTIMIQYQSVHGDDFRLLIPTRTQAEYNDMVERVSSYADAERNTVCPS